MRVFWHCLGQASSYLPRAGLRPVFDASLPGINLVVELVMTKRPKRS